MKKVNFISVIIALTILTACSSSDDNEVEIIVGDYFPAKATSLWSYDVIAKDSEESTSVENVDFLTVESPTSTSIDLDVNNGNSANGFMSEILSEGTLNRTDSELYLNGEIQIPIDGIDDVEIPFSNAKLYDLNASDNEEFNVFSNSFTQNLGGIPLNFTYTLSFNKLKDQSSLTVNNVKYNNVTSSNISLKLSIDTTIEVQGIDKDFILLNESEILTIKSYFGEDTGLLKSESVISYELDDATVLLLETLGVDIAMEESASKTNSQTLTSFTIGN